MTKKHHPSHFVEEIGPKSGKELAGMKCDPNVKLPDDIRATISQGKKAFQRFNRRYKTLIKRQSKANNSPKIPRSEPVFVTSIVDQDIQDRRDAKLQAIEQHARGKRCQPPMLNRLRVGAIIVDRLIAEGVPPKTGRNSQMNRLIGEWFNGRVARSSDRRKSRCKTVKPDAVQQTLRQIKDLG